MWSNIQNEFNLNLANHYKKKRNNVVVQEIREKEKIPFTFDKTIPGL